MTATVTRALLLVVMLLLTTQQLTGKSATLEKFSALTAERVTQVKNGLQKLSGGQKLKTTLAILALASTFVTGCERGMREDILSNQPISIEKQVNEMLLVGFRGESIAGDEQRMLADIQPGGVILFDSGGAGIANITSPEQVRALTAEIRATVSDDVLIAVDAEGGFVNRLKTKYGFEVDVPSAETLGEGTTEETFVIASDLAQQMRSVGINLNLAPVVDVNVFDQSPAIGYYERSFSDDPEIVISHAQAFIRGHKQHKVFTTLKHFPGHGSATGDTHLGVTDITDTYQPEREQLPYATLIANGYKWPIMTAHITYLPYDSVPATLSHRIVTQLLRNELGFDGVVISDDMQMGAIVAEYSLDGAAIEAVLAGVDIVLLANKNNYDLQDIYLVRDAIVGAVEDGIISEYAIATSWVRIKKLKEQL